MGRIPEEELERIKRETDLEALVRARGVALTQHGADLLGRCPFHDDHSPSLVVSPKKNLWHCLGACSTGGSVVDWVMKAEGVSFRHAVEILRAGGPPPAFGAPPVARSSVLKLPPPVALDASDHELLLQVVDYYHASLKTSPEALAYLAKRGIHDPAVISTFRLGFANRTLGLRLPEKTRAEGARIRERLAALGIYRASSGHEHFNGCLVIPVLDEQGRVAEVYGRKIRDDLRPGTAYHLYLPGPHRGVPNLAALRASKEIILCEALIDALTFWCAGFRNVTAAYGVNGFTADHLEAMKAYGTERVLIAYDRDQAGEAAAEALATALAGEGIACFRVRFPHGLDANAYASKVTPARESLAVLVRSAEYMAGPVSLRLQGAALADDPEPAEEPPPAGQGQGSGPASSLAAIFEATGTKALERPADQSAHPPASPLPPGPRPDIPAEVSDSEIVLRLGDRRYRVRGLAANTAYDVLKINLMVSRGEGLHVDTLNLYSARQRAIFASQAAAELGVKDEVIAHDLGKVLVKLETLQDELIRKALEPKAAAVTIGADERAAALAYLRAPDLLERIAADFERCGLVGERTNALVGTLAALSRKLDEPLAVIVQSSSAAGKSALMEAILAFVPPEDRIQYSAMTGQSLFYMGEADLKHKILAIAEEEGAERAAYALKLLQSEGELTIASTGKDPSTGRLVTHEYRVEGPVGIFLTTTAIDIDEELLNRCLVLTVNEDREQTRAIHRLQRERHTLEGLLARQDRDQLLALHRNAQRLVQPLPVVNPYARHLTFSDDKTRTRRDHLKYLTLIRTIALVHQHQRPRKTCTHRGRPVEYIEVTLADIERANRLAHEVLGRTLDELPPQTRRLARLLDAMVTEACSRLAIERCEHRFSRADVRHATGWSYPQVRSHLERLVEMEYVVVHKGGRGQSFVYELVWDGKGEESFPHLSGLLDTEALRQEVPTTTALTPGPATLTPETVDLDPRLSPQCSSIDRPLRSDERTEELVAIGISGPEPPPRPKRSTPMHAPERPSYLDVGRTLALGTGSRGE